MEIPLHTKKSNIALGFAFLSLLTFSCAPQKEVPKIDDRRCIIPSGDEATGGKDQICRSDGTCITDDLLCVWEASDSDRPCWGDPYCRLPCSSGDPSDPCAAYTCGVGKMCEERDLYEEPSSPLVADGFKEVCVDYVDYGEPYTSGEDCSWQPQAFSTDTASTDTCVPPPGGTGNCAENSWYCDGECDSFCDQCDPDCAECS